MRSVAFQLYFFKDASNAYTGPAFRAGPEHQHKAHNHHGKHLFVRKEKKCCVFIFFYIQHFPKTKVTMNADLWLAKSTAFTLFQCSATDRRNTARVGDKARRPKTVGF